MNLIIDIAKDKVEADVKDLNHGALYSSSPVTVKLENMKIVKMQI